MKHPQKYMREVKEKEKNRSRLAYKVTECYPLEWNFGSKVNEGVEREEKWRRVPPAGMSSRSLNTR